MITDSRQSTLQAIFGEVQALAEASLRQDPISGNALVSILLDCIEFLHSGPMSQTELKVISGIVQIVKPIILMGIPSTIENVPNYNRVPGSVGPAPNPIRSEGNRLYRYIDDIISDNDNFISAVEANGEDQKLSKPIPDWIGNLIRARNTLDVVPIGDIEKTAQRRKRRSKSELLDQSKGPKAEVNRHDVRLASAARASVVERFRGAVGSLGMSQKQGAEGAIELWLASDAIIPPPTARGTAPKDDPLISYKVRIDPDIAQRFDDAVATRGGTKLRAFNQALDMWLAEQAPTN